MEGYEQFQALARQLFESCRKSPDLYVMPWPASVFHSIAEVALHSEGSCLPTEMTKKAFNEWLVIRDRFLQLGLTVWQGRYDHENCPMPSLIPSMADIPAFVLRRTFSVMQELASLSRALRPPQATQERLEQLWQMHRSHARNELQSIWGELSDSLNFKLVQLSR